jgi:transcriptional regulatory protein LevR
MSLEAKYKSRPFLTLINIAKKDKDILATVANFDVKYKTIKHSGTFR